MVVGARQSFRLFRQIVWFLGNNRTLSKFRHWILYNLISITKFWKNLSIIANFNSTMQAVWYQHMISAHDIKSEFCFLSQSKCIHASGKILSGGNILVNLLSLYLAKEQLIFWQFLVFEKENVLNYGAFSGFGFDFARVFKTAYETLLIPMYFLNLGLKEKKREKNVSKRRLFYLMYPLQFIKKT